MKTSDLNPTKQWKAGKPKKRKSRRTNSADIHGYKRRDESLAILRFESYQEYLQSELWASIRQRVLRLTKGNCRCCRIQRATQIHHRHYSISVMSGEDIKSLIPLCAACHRYAEFDDGNKVGLATANKRLADRCKSNSGGTVIRVTYIDHDDPKNSSPYPPLRRRTQRRKKRRK